MGELCDATESGAEDEDVVAARRRELLERRRRAANGELSVCDGMALRPGDSGLRGRVAALNFSWKSFGDADKAEKERARDLLTDPNFALGGDDPAMKLYGYDAVLPAQQHPKWGRANNWMMHSPGCCGAFSPSCAAGTTVGGNRWGLRGTDACDDGRQCSCPCHSSSGGAPSLRGAHMPTPDAGAGVATSALHIPDLDGGEDGGEDQGDPVVITVRTLGGAWRPMALAAIKADATAALERLKTKAEGASKALTPEVTRLKTELSSEAEAASKKKNRVERRGVAWEVYPKDLRAIPRTSLDDDTAVAKGSLRVPSLMMVPSSPIRQRPEREICAEAATRDKDRQTALEQLAAAQTQVEDLKGKLSEAQAMSKELAAAQTRVEDLKGKLAAAETQVSDLKGKLSEAQRRFNELATEAGEERRYPAYLVVCAEPGLPTRLVWEVAPSAWGVISGGDAANGAIYSVSPGCFVRFPGPECEGASFADTMQCFMLKVALGCLVMDDSDLLCYYRHMARTASGVPRGSPIWNVDEALTKQSMTPTFSVPGALFVLPQASETRTSLGPVFAARVSRASHRSRGHPQVVQREVRREDEDARTPIRGAQRARPGVLGATPTKKRRMELFGEDTEGGR